MGLRDLFVFNVEAYERKVSSSSYSSGRIQRNIQKKRRQCYGAATAIPTGLGLAVITFGATAITSLIAMRNLSVAQIKLRILEKELRRRGYSSSKPTWVRDRIMPAVVGAATLGLGNLVQEGFTSDRDLSRVSSRRDSYGYRRSRSSSDSRASKSSSRRKLIYESSDGRRTHIGYSPKSSSRRSSSRSARSSSRSRHHRESSRHGTQYVDVHRDSRRPSMGYASSSRASLALPDEYHRDFRPPIQRSMSMGGSRVQFAPRDDNQFRTPAMSQNSSVFRNETPAHYPVQYTENRNNVPGGQNFQTEGRINGGGASFGYDATAGQQQWTGPQGPYQPSPPNFPSNNFMQQNNNPSPFQNGYQQ
ncbi:hypothetical protein SCHPADRAFT_628242 [Schizopora paradoxa]|uniref:Uncharacterized protein n=1 Tax=Schizopora paradoxa TaxID=27342 RepID=A0A0H2R979_9AGAM|nr:hypothetical protein SCHPADRAFT_628242 [Schizopora paradoxa]